MRIAFAGTPEFAKTTLSALHSAGHEIVAVFTQPDKAAGRGLTLQASPVKQEAQQLGLEVLQPYSLNEGQPGAKEAIERLVELQPEFMVVVAYGLLLPKTVLQIPQYGCVNIHASLLPRWRGAAPIQRAIEAGDSQTGVAVMQMEEGLDTGPVWLSCQTTIQPDDNFQTLHDRLALMGAKTICDFFRQWASESRSLMTAIPQPSEGVTYAHKISKYDTLIRWNQSAQKVFHQIRALSPSPGATAQLGAQSIKVFEALPLERTSSPQGSSRAFKPGEIIQANAAGLHVACETGVISLLTLQKAGGKRLGYREFLNGQSLRAGDIFSAESTILAKPEPWRPASPRP